ncbi:MAG: dihydrolipoamide acetyltransferase family protein [Actinomycetota bacterium]
MGERVFALPDLGEGLEDAVLTRWLVAEGEEVELNQPIAEIETAKAVVEMPSPFAGRIARLHVSAGETVAVGGPLVTFFVGEGSPPGSAPGESSPTTAMLPGVVGGDEPPTPTPGGSSSAGATSVAATPAVRRLAKDLGVDLSTVTPSGSDTRITREDVEAAAGGGDAEVVPVSLVRKAIAENLTKVAAIPQVTTFRQVDCTALEAFRGELGVSPLPVFVRALAEICGEHRMLNATWNGDRILVHRGVNVGIATDTERGLVVPVLKYADSKGIAEISGEIAGLADAARSNTLPRDEVTGATIAVTNTGSYGSEFGTPLLNPGHAVTIALGLIEPRALVVDGRVEARQACTLSLTFDHRVLDGAIVGRAFGALVDLLESSERLGALPR